MGAKPCLLTTLALVFSAGVALPGQASTATAERAAEWEVGAGLAALTRPDYPGSNESRTYPAVFPYFIYRTERYAVTREGVRGQLFGGGESWELGLSAAATLPLRSEDNDARRGMPDLDVQGELGPNLQIDLFSSSSVALRFELPVRGSLNLSNGDFTGWTTVPKLVLRTRVKNWRLGGYAGLKFSDQDYHDRIYSVGSRFVTPERAGFRASGGLTSWRVSVSANYRNDQNLFGVFLAYDDYRDAENRDSPLLLDDGGIQAGIIYTRLLARSSARVNTSIDE